MTIKNESLFLLNKTEVVMARELRVKNKQTNKT